MKRGRSQDLASTIATTTVAALVGLLLLGNATTAPAPLQILDVVAGFVFIGTAIWLALFNQEDK